MMDALTVEHWDVVMVESMDRVRAVLKADKLDVQKASKKVVLLVV
jgi:hypothetical protein